MNGEVPRWYDQAACKGKPTAWWFSNNPAEYRLAKQVCDVCPVITECDAYATLAREHGIWGGRARKLGSDSLVDVSMRRCKICGEVFEANRTAGRMPTVCGDDCRRERKQRVGRASSMKRTLKPGSMFDRGHGTISRYRAGCKCQACKRVARRSRALHRASA